MMPGSAAGDVLPSSLSVSASFMTPFTASAASYEKASILIVGAEAVFRIDEFEVGRAFELYETVSEYPGEG
jgi:hypothetical protein